MKVIQKIVLLSLCGAFLCACQTKSQDNTPYSLAVDTGSRMQPTKLVPVPMPGQLMSLKKTGDSKKLVGEAAIEEANKKAMKQPGSSGYINSIMTFDYMSGALYQLYSAPLSVTDVQFQNNEHIIAVGAGDSLRWQITKTYSGVGANRQEHLLIKPTDEGLTNSLVVTTDLRTYHMMLHSTPKTYMASVTWRYPNNDNLITKFDDDAGDDFADVTGGININRLTFNYEVKLLKGSTPDWYPKVVFNDGSKTYIKFASQAQDTPSLFIGDKKNNQITNFRVQGNYYIIDSVITQALLRGGAGSKSLVQITMKKK
jgi:type IV secretion system protein TrbG